MSPQNFEDIHRTRGLLNFLEIHGLERSAVRIQVLGLSKLVVESPRRSHMGKLGAGSRRGHGSIATRGV